MKKNYIIYIVISVLCAIAIIAGVYYEVFMKKPKTVDVANETQGQNEVTEAKQEPEDILEEFNNLFNNSFDDQGYEIENVKKIAGYEDKEIIYAIYTFNDEKDEKYNCDINIPLFNIDGEVPAKFNSITQSIFANKANDVLTKSEKFTIYNIEYVGYLNENILSLVIKSTLKEGNNPQRIIVQTYNYDITTGKEVTLNEVLSSRNINQKEVNKKIETEVKKAAEEAQAVATALAEYGQTIYERDVNNAMYVTDNANYFFIGEDGQIYIIYPYGNSNFTSEIDIIKI